MSELNRQDIRKLAKNLMFDLSDDEISDIQSEFEVLMKQLALLEAIDTETIEPMVTPFETPTHFLREDEVDAVIPVEEALLNAPKRDGNYFVIPKVVNDEL